MNDTTQWVVLELSHQGEKLPQTELLGLLALEVGPEVEVFIPTLTFTRRDSILSVCLMEGYFFIEAGLPAASYLGLEDLAFVKRVLTQDERDGRFICYVGNEVVQDLRDRLAAQAARTIEKEDSVLVVEGVYANLRGKVVDVYPEKDSAMIHIVELKSMKILVELPFQFVEHLNEEYP